MLNLNELCETLNEKFPGKHDWFWSEKDSSIIVWSLNKVHLIIEPFIVFNDDLVSFKFDLNLDKMNADNSHFVSRDAKIVDFVKEWLEKQVLE